MNRRRFIAAALAAPLVVREGLLMPVKPVWEPVRVVPVFSIEDFLGPWPSDQQPHAGG